LDSETKKKVLTKVLTGEVALRTRQIFAELAIEKGWDILALEVAPDQSICLLA
jgi:REP element-mobilizing transposase RayT